MGFDEKLSRGERKAILERLIPKQVRPNGFRCFAGDRRFQSVELPVLMEKRMENLRNKMGNEDHIFTTQEYFRISEDCKLDAWKALTDKEKEYWRKEAKRLTKEGKDDEGLPQ